MVKELPTNASKTIYSAFHPISVEAMGRRCERYQQQMISAEALLADTLREFGEDKKINGTGLVHRVTPDVKVTVGGGTYDLHIERVLHGPNNMPSYSIIGGRPSIDKSGGYNDPVILYEVTHDRGIGEKKGVIVLRKYSHEAKGLRYTYQTRDADELTAVATYVNRACREKADDNGNS